MSRLAATLGINWQDALRQIEDGWDTHSSKAPTIAAIQALETFSVVPCFNGGIQLEVHRDGVSVEISISPEGRVESVCLFNASK